MHQLELTIENDSLKAWLEKIVIKMLLKYLHKIIPL